MDIHLSDITIHIDEALDATRRRQTDDALRAIDGVVSVHNPDDKPHLLIVQYNPKKTASADLLAAVKAQGVHAELIGL